MYASLHNHVNIVKLLIEAVVNINAKNNIGYTALMIALIYDHKEIVMMLINASTVLK